MRLTRKFPGELVPGQDFLVLEDGQQTLVLQVYRIQTEWTIETQSSTIKVFNGKMLDTVSKKG